MGSRILSRSFHNEGWDYGDSEDEDQQPMNISADMDVDEAPPLLDPAPEAEDEGERSDSEEEEEEDGTAMVPFADLLNARYGCSNVGPIPSPSR
jgi:N-lysine methyltransferase SETD6